MPWLTWLTCNPQRFLQSRAPIPSFLPSASAAARHGTATASPHSLTPASSILTPTTHTPIHRSHRCSTSRPLILIFSLYIRLHPLDRQSGAPSPHSPTLILASPSHSLADLCLAAGRRRIVPAHPATLPAALQLSSTDISLLHLPCGYITTRWSHRHHKQHLLLRPLLISTNVTTQAAPHR